jgi:hypothetical protein
MTNSESSSEGYYQMGFSGRLSAAAWVGAGLVMIAALSIVLYAGSIAGWGVAGSAVTLTPTRAAATATLTPTATPEPATPTPQPPTETPLPASVTPTATFTPSPTLTPWPTWTPTETPTTSPTGIPCPGNQTWNGSECVCPPDTVWVAQGQWCTGKK